MRAACVVTLRARAQAGSAEGGALGGPGGLGEVDAQVVRQRVGGVQAQRALQQPLRLRRLRLERQRAMRVRLMVRPPAAARPGCVPWVSPRMFAPRLAR